MKKITQVQCDSILQAFFDVNAPIKLYVGLKEIFEKLPEVTEEKVEEKPTE